MKENAKVTAIGYIVPVLNLKSEVFKKPSGNLMKLLLKFIAADLRIITKMNLPPFLSQIWLGVDGVRDERPFTNNNLVSNTKVSKTIAAEAAARGSGLSGLYPADPPSSKAGLSGSHPAAGGSGSVRFISRGPSTCASPRSCSHWRRPVGFTSRGTNASVSP